MTVSVKVEQRQDRVKLDVKVTVSPTGELGQFRFHIILAPATGNCMGWLLGSVYDKVPELIVVDVFPERTNFLAQLQAHPEGHPAAPPVTQAVGQRAHV
jgi:hypothetical protein